MLQNVPCEFMIFDAHKPWDATCLGLPWPSLSPMLAHFSQGYFKSSLLSPKLPLPVPPPPVISMDVLASYFDEKVKTTEQELPKQPDTTAPINLYLCSFPPFPLCGCSST